MQWTEAGAARSARWQSENATPPPRRLVVADDTMDADTAYRLACEGTGLLWRGDFQNARQLLQALARRIDRPARRPRKAAGAGPVEAAAVSPRDGFNRYRLAKSQRARLLGMLVLPLAADYSMALRRAPDWRQACTEAYGPAPAADAVASDEGGSLVALRELLGVVGAHEWRKKGVEIPALGPAPSNRIHPHYGVFSPVRGEYLDLVANTPWPGALRAPDPPDFDGLVFDIGTGTGVLAALLARRGASRIVATDLDPRALACARENIERLGCAERVQVIEADLFPPLSRFGKAMLFVCNPPWLPARPSSRLEQAVYDPDSRMLRGFLAGLAGHLAPGGEGWLILSDLAEHLGLRQRDEVLTLIEGAGLTLLGRTGVRPQHPKAMDPNDALFAARSAEVTSLWRLAAR